MNPRRNSQMLKNLKTLTPKEERSFKYDRRMKYTHKGRETNLLDIGEQKAQYIMYLDKIKEINLEHGISVSEIDKLLKKLKIQPEEKTKLRDHNGVLRKDMALGRARLAELEIVEEEIKAMQIILERTKDKKQIDQYINIIDILNTKAKAYINKTGSKLDPKSLIFEKNAMIEITKIIKSTPPKDMSQTLRVIANIIVNW